ncbi:MAG: hypothetical protein M3444_05550 [Acidobacteriota bacterium]|nr:hypothetical protein [Acidobacteriota bacterium]MDQ5839322.1 hypothetical protein [Acidobacteriota bacterium]
MKLAPRHIPFERLVDLAEGRVAPEESRDASAHLSTCAACAGQLAQVERLTQVMRTDNSEDAPRDLLAGALNLFRARPRREGFLRRVVAALSFDSGALRPAFGVRSGQATSSRQLLFSAGDVDVDLRLAPGEEGWAVSGQVLGECAGGWAELGGAEDEGRAARAELNELCEFALPAVPAGSYTLRLRLDDLLVEIPDLNLRA